MRRALIERFRERLNLPVGMPAVSLGEGGTPLVPAERLARACGLPEGSVYLKCEGANPTGSFKDRGMTLAVSKAAFARSKGVLCASTGNTAASASAYAARAGLACAVFLPAGQVALGKLGQAVMHGARVLQVRGNFDEALKLALETAASAGWAVVNSSNPDRLEGQKTAAFEICEDLGRAPDWQFMPVGNAGNITAYWRGYCEFERGRPRMMGWQAAGAAPLVLGRVVKNPKTVATAIRIGDPVSRAGALKARDESGGAIGAVGDAEILAAYRFLAREEGVFCEPSSAAGVAGLMKLCKKKKPRGTVVCILTGHGLKDPETPLSFKFKPEPVKVGQRIKL